MMPTADQIDAILPFLDHFEVAGFSAGSWKMPEGQFPWFGFEATVIEFQQALYDNGWIAPFDWGAWQETAREYVENPGKIESADAEAIQKLFTTHVRKERFCEGHLAAMFENGHVVVLLRRLKVIRDDSKSTHEVKKEPSARTKGDNPMTPPEKIAKEFPKEGELQLFRLEKFHEFQCVRCQENKKSKTVAVQGGDWSMLLCNGCYGLLQSKKG